MTDRDFIWIMVLALCIAAIIIAGFYYVAVGVQYNV